LQYHEPSREQIFATTQVGPSYSIYNTTPLYITNKTKENKTKYTMAAEPTTPIRVPKAAATYTPSTQDPDLRHQINTILLKDGHISK